ncbi:beta-ketoacyl synthase [Streptomyces sp. NBC_00454]|uniref:beta-ketoacyl-[acyl-carrier-protein] synthase family protein n=1 Tax=Streptomyces sp. NBC_00454 TaxID=2975747 RepID=UPI00324750FF
MAEPARRRVVVTGLGAISSLGIGARPFIDGIKAGRSGISPIESFDRTGFPRSNAGEVRGFEPEKLLHNISPAEWGRSAQFAAAAARLAVEDSGLDPELLAVSRAGSSMGTTNGESSVVDKLTEQWVQDGPGRLTPELVAQVPAGRISAAVNTELGLTGEAQTIGTACSASNYALGYGYDQVSLGDSDYMICGGADSVNRSTHAGFYRLGSIAAEVSRPFDAERDGILTAEGGVALLLEPLDAALERGARIYAEVLGYAVNCDADHMVHPHRGSIAECIRQAHHNSGVVPEDVDYVCAHGTGTQVNDSTEVGAVREVFGDRMPPVSSIKSMLGHTMGAAAGFGALVCCAAIHEGFLPPSATVRKVDPALGSDLDCVPGQARKASPRVVENHGFAFGGNNAIVMLAEVNR